MSNLFGVDFRGLFASALGLQLYDATLVKSTPGAYNASDPSAGTSPTTVSYPCKVVPTKIEHAFVVDELTTTITGAVLVLLGTLPAGVAPGPGDTISLVNPKDGTVMVGKVSSPTKTDPAGASMTCEVLA